MLDFFRRLAAPRRDTHAPTARPRLEPLEDRCVPTTVTNTGDAVGDPNSLRGAIAATAAGGTVNFAPGLSGTITLTAAAGGQIALTKSVTITGPGAGVITVSGNNASRIFFSNTAGLNLSISGLTLTGGNTTGSGNWPAGNGGAIRENGDNLTLTACTLTGNTAANNVAGYQRGGGGALYAQSGTLTVSNCTITNNHALVRRGGGICVVNASVTIQNSTITGNDSFTGSPDAGGGGGLFLSGTGVKTITGCNISGNTANYGGAVYFKDAPAGSSMQNCTITGNKASFNAMANPKSGGGGGVLLYNGALTIENCTVSGNSAPNTQGGGIKVKNDSYDTPPTKTAVLTLSSTIVSGNTDVSGANDINRYANALVTINADHDLFQTAPTAGTINGTNSANITGVNPLLGALQNNGGPTFTEALSAGSPAIDKGSNPAGLATDQRGFTRSVGGGTDIGAFEVQAPLVLIPPSATLGGLAGAPFSFAVTAQGGAGVVTMTYSVSGVPGLSVTPPSPTTGRGISLHGVPASEGPVQLLVTATDQAGATAVGVYNFFFIALSPSPPIPPTPPTQQAPAVFATGAGPGGLPVVNVYDAATGAFKYQFRAFEAGFSGGTTVAVARDRQGRDVIAVGAGPGGFLVRTFVAGPSGVTPLGQVVPFGTLTNGVYQGFTGGIFVALGDLRGDGQLEVVCGPGAAPNSDPFVNGWSLDGTMQVVPNTYAFEKGFHGGVRVAVGDVDGDGKNEVVAGAGPGGMPYVQVVNGQAFALEKRFLAFGAGFMGGVTVATGILDASGVARVVAGADGGDGSPGDAPVLSTFTGTGAPLVSDVPAFEATYHGGVNVGTSLDGRRSAWILAAPAGRHNPQVDIFSANFVLLPQSFTVIDATTKLADANFANGVAVGG
jgi:hypothetical protein